MKPSESESMWRKQSRQWQHVGAPLRPTEEDQHLLFSVARTVLNHPAPRLMVMGVTPEVVNLPWPADAHLTAVDRCEQMIARVWQPHEAISSAVECADWHRLPFEDKRFQLVIGDGCTTQFEGESDYLEIFAELSRVLRDDGLLTMRCFIRPDTPESLDAVVTAAHAADINNFGSLKWRLAMALVGHSQDMVIPVTRITEAFDELFPDRDALATEANWAREEIDTIDAYRDNRVCYTFPTLTELENILNPYFWLENVCTASYELASQCPILSLRKSRQN